MGKKLGLDLGTNSIGWTIRNTSLDDNQFEKYGVITFKKGVGEGKSGEFSLAAERTKNRSVRRLYQARKYRLWETLKVLIDNDYCPLSIKDLDMWRKYDNDKGLFRKYPIHATSFEQWIRLDFYNQNIPFYTSPYQLRKELIENEIDITDKINRYKIGRALYHIAQRRGFKSSRKTGDKENTSVYKGSKESGAKGVNDIIELIEKYKTLGAAQAYIESKGLRVRNQYTLRKYYQEEVNIILEKQGISTKSEFYKSIIKAIFYQRPLRSQKGLIGKCTLEPNKSRCPISHPYFEEFRAWCFLNNIQFKNTEKDNWTKLPLTLKENIYNEIFFRKKKDYFAFKEIKEYLEKNNFKWILNFKDKTNVSGCPVSARLKGILGNDWVNYEKTTNEIRTTRNGKGTIKNHKITYKIEDIWHILFSFEDEECIADFAKTKLELEDDKINYFLITWKQLPDGYAMLSLNAIKKIIPFLRKGHIYTEAVLLANMPSVFGKNIWEKKEAHLTNYISTLIDRNRNEKNLLNIVNELISKWYSNGFNNGYRDSSYILDKRDDQLIKTLIIDTYGNKTWEEKTNEEKEDIHNQVKCLYQYFFQDTFEWIRINDDKYYVIKTARGTFYKNLGNGYYKIPHLLNFIKEHLKEEFNLKDKELDKLYHPSQIEYYPKSKPDEKGKILLRSPKTGSFKNPMAMRTLYELRKLINYLISSDEIDEETEIVVELARELNDNNKRWAIEAYQRRKEEENKEYAIAITELLNDPEVFGIIKADPNNTDDIDKFRLWQEQITYKKKFKKEPSVNKVDKEGKEIENNDRSLLP
ncbi:MAG: hypothetical protein P4L45_08745, partial [Ignavibacteriaceae bacterium]|nr:hypothetical protein [Ignavibacteriaceae bacterium]